MLVAALLTRCEAVSQYEILAPQAGLVPAPVPDLAATSATDSSVTLSFTEVDDGTKKPANYGIRYGVAPMTWATATTVSQGPCAAPLMGAVIGRKRSCHVAALTPTTNYEFQIVAIKGTSLDQLSTGRRSSVAASRTLPAVSHVLVGPSPVNRQVGQTAPFTATVRDDDGNVLSDRPVIWTSSDSNVARVNDGGLAVSMNPGTTTIMATSEGKSGEATLTVTPVPVASVEVVPAPVNLGVGRTAQLFAGVHDVDGNILLGRTVSWSSNAPGVVSVNSTGFITGASLGSATITATAEGHSGGSQVTTNAVPVASVAVSPLSGNLTVGQTSQLTTTIRDAGGNILTGRAVSWSSSAPSVATVSSSGFVTATSAGSATITANSEGQTGQSQFTVTGLPVASVTVSPASPSIVLGQTSQLTATTRDAGGNVLTGRTISWSSNAPLVVSTNTTGLVSANLVGAATITATSEGRTGQSQVTVNLIPVATVTLNPLAASLVVGQTTQLGAALRDAGGNLLSGRTTTWSSSAPGIASVNSSGVVTGAGAGSAVITATAEGHSGGSQITVTLVPVATVAVSPATANLVVGQTSQLTATLRDAGGNTLTGRTIAWTTSRASVANVNASGLATSTGAGTATITATSEGRAGSSQFTVTAPPVATVTVTPGTIGLTTGQQAQLTATMRDASGNVLTGRTVTWSSSASSVADVISSGLMSAVAPGTATITATSEGRTGQSQATVTAPPPGGIAWFSDWRTATGAVTAAIRDGLSSSTQKWNNESGGGQSLDVISAAGRGFPSDMTNILRANTPGNTLSHMLMVTGKWSTPPVGGSVFYRVYFRGEIPDGTDMGSSHPLQNGLTNLAWEWKLLDPESGHQVLVWMFNPLTTNYPHQIFDSGNNTNRKTPVISSNTTYRIEWQIFRATATTGKVSLRVYDSANNLIMTSANFWAEAGGGFNSLANDNPDMQLGNVDAAFQEINLGNNGPLVGSRTGNNFSYWGGFAVSTTDWVGPYSSTRG